MNDKCAQAGGLVSRLLCRGVGGIVSFWNWLKGLFGDPLGDEKPDQDRMMIEMFAYLRRDRQAARFRRGLMLVGFVIIMVAPLGFYVFSNLPEGYWAGGNKIGFVRVDGIVGMQNGVDADRVNKSLRRAFASKAVAVVLKIDSPGGSPYTADRIVSAIRLLKEEHPDKPIYAVIERTGASAAYMIAMHADKIYVGNYSAVGSIGAILSSWDLHELSARFDVSKHVFATGSLKGMLDPFKEMTEEESRKAQAIVDAVGTTFTDQVIERRGDALKISREELSTGEVWVGREAVAIGLADEVGNIDTLADELDATPMDMTSHRSPLSSGARAVFDALAGAFVSALREPVMF